MNPNIHNGRWRPDWTAANRKPAARRPGCVWCVIIGLLLAISLAFGADNKISLAWQDPNSQVVQENDLLIATIPTTLPMRQLWQARISASQEPKASSKKEQLQKLIEQINAIEFGPQPATPEPAVVVQTVPKTEPNELVSAAEPVSAPPAASAENKLPDGFISEKTLLLFNSRIKSSEGLENPLEMADILFSSGRLKEAAVCYQQAMDRPAADASDVFGNKAWALLQLGNCLRKDNPQAALEKYKAVIVECPGSIWEDLAKAKSQMVEWYLQDQPAALIENSKL